MPRGQTTEQSAKELLEALHLPQSTGPKEWYLTEFEDHWPYRAAPADLYWHRSGHQEPIRRPPVIQYVSTSLPADATLWTVAAMLVMPVVVRRRKR